ncbi:ABC transporter permease [Malaciobacter molluscorum LMG 25693]|uniref:ABC transporter permease n=1 Tax=Malaciobacter molluscorum LMG 25693 TaxID=870501 RepID=A0A2G1DF72_9BACT|nr:ABC transporter permease [Malaciobacter molluscorum]AXX91262.1 lipid asymmetry ABC transporter MlaABCDEF, permease component MlaE [Malaciobacter molluscorum LMG 25693]PHO17148.1 ABC transporter permease [Malaciobacter molluscorum LMG 25693]RXJ92367.1 ABC transporter permease [Malaciobacter molluscorum]
MQSFDFKPILYNETLKITLYGTLDKFTLPQLIKYLNKKKYIFLEFNLEHLKKIDSIATIYLISLNNINITNKDKFTDQIEYYKKHYISNKNIKKRNSLNYLEKLGKSTYEKIIELNQFIYFFGKLFFFFFYTILNPKKIRFNEILKSIETSAISAISIIALTSFLVGIVIAYQGAVQLEKFGGNIYIVEMVCITMFREIAPLVTAIVIAGRTASSYTAQIGAMQITEEVDAMKTMGFEPTIFLTLPRVFALFISLPLLVFFADAISVFSGMIVAFFDLKITFHEFINRMYQEVELKHFLIGVIKSSFFGIVIAIIGCYRGFQVQNNTTSIGKYTTISVVNAIFTVIALNAIFSVILTESGI